MFLILDSTCLHHDITDILVTYFVFSTVYLQKGEDKNQGRCMCFFMSVVWWFVHRLPA